MTPRSKMDEEEEEHVTLRSKMGSTTPRCQQHTKRN
jgi:hypothetical protein